MSASTIKAAMSALLAANIASLKSIKTQYQRLSPRSRTPRAIIWDLGFREERLAGGVGGLKQIEWRIGTHLVVYAKNPDTDGAAFDTLLADVQALYRAHPVLDGAADTDTSRVIGFAESMAVDKPPPQIARQFVLYQAVITCNVREVVTA